MCVGQPTARHSRGDPPSPPLLQPASAAGDMDVHALASEAAEFEASVERFFDDALITDIKDTPLTTLDGVLEERREREERMDRVRGRAKELLEEELAKERHERELRELKDAISVAQPEDANASSTAGGAASSSSSVQQQSQPHQRRKATPGGVGATAESVASGARATAAAPTTELPFELEGAGRSRELNPYVANFTDFVAEVEASRQARELRAESELLRQCLQGANARRSKAFEPYRARPRVSNPCQPPCALPH